MTAWDPTETYVFWYSGPGGEPKYYRIKGFQVSPDVAEIRVYVRGELALEATSMADAEEFIKFHRHEIALGHAPGTCRCFD
jgi:hypothetical protein